VFHRDTIRPSVDAPDDRTPSRSVGTFISRLSAYVADALRYWEMRRLVYNAVLACVVAIDFVVAWPASYDKLSFDLLLGLFILSVIANIAFCAVYVVDLFVQFSGLHTAWRWGRLVLLIIGTAFASTIAHFTTRGFFGQ
jgi:hypothetical protein